jgi:KTSC domain
MNRTSVKSSNIKSIGYSDGVLEVEFKRKTADSAEDSQPGQVYQYEGVPAAEYEALMKAESIGKHFSANIRTAYTGKKIEDIPKAVKADPLKEAVIFLLGQERIRLERQWERINGPDLYPEPGAADAMEKAWKRSIEIEEVLKRE